MMEPANKPLIDHLLKGIKAGDIQLPEFQRDYIWTGRQKSELIESIFQKHPVGTLLLLEIDPEAPMFAWTALSGIDTPENRLFSAYEEDKSAAKPPKQLILDGQQRLTTIAQILNNTNLSAYTWYLSLKEVMESWFSNSEPSSTEKLSDWIESFDFSSTIRANKWSQDPGSAFRSKSFRLAICLLNDFASLNVNLNQYREYCETQISRERARVARPGASEKVITVASGEIEELERRKKFVQIVIPQLAQIVSNYSIPAVTVPMSMSVPGVCKIFTKLNSTGTPLGPFDLTVAKLYPHKINLKKKYREAVQASPQIASVDTSGTSLLSTAALFAGQSPKKNSLPQTIKADVFSTYWDTSVKSFVNAINHLNDYCGAGIVPSQQASLLAYAPIVPALAHALGEKKLDEISNVQHRQICEKALRVWYFHAPLLKHYSDGTDNKQQTDSKVFREIFQNKGDTLPEWFAENSRPSLLKTLKNGARGRAILSLINLRSPHDWYFNSKAVGRGAAKDNDSQLHHIFPKDFLKSNYAKSNGGNMPDDIDGFLSDLGMDSVLNLTFLTPTTNNVIINNRSPKDYLHELEARFPGALLYDEMAKHLIDKKCIDCMRTENFAGFLEAREKYVYEILGGYGLKVTDGSIHTSDDEAVNDLFEEDDEEVYTL